jgi:O-antigen ligase
MTSLDLHRRTESGQFDSRRPEPVRQPVDAVTVLTAYVVLLIGIPSRYVLAPIGAVGTPAWVVGLGGLFWWCSYRLMQPASLVPVVQPARRAFLFVVASILASYVVAMSRPVNAAETSTAQAGLLSLAGWAGILLLATDGVTSRERLDRLLRRLSIAGGLAAALGIAQFQTHRPLTEFLRLPGLTANQQLDSVLGRNGFPRPAGTAAHPIEFGVMLTILLPIALHYALHDQHRGKVRRWFPVITLSAAIPLSVSRTAVISTVIVLLFVMPTWSARIRRRGYLFITAMLAAVFVSVPGMLSTLTGLFTGIGSDDSAASRTDSYTLAWTFIERAPVFGRGFSTFLPSYRILDNQYLLTMIDTGFVGLFTLLALFACSFLVMFRVRRHSTDPTTRRLAQTLAASIAAGAASFAFFDALSFPLLAGLVFLVIGCANALYRLETTSSGAAQAVGTVRAVSAAPSAAPRSPAPADRR